MSSVGYDRTQRDPVAEAARRPRPARGFLPSEPVAVRSRARPDTSFRLGHPRSRSCRGFFLSLGAVGLLLLFLTVACAQIPQPPACDDGGPGAAEDLVLFYPFDKIPAEPWIRDWSVFRNHANRIGSPWVTPYGLFLEPGDALDAGNDRSLHFRESFTVALWMKRTRDLTNKSAHLVTKGSWALVLTLGHKLNLSTKAATGEDVDLTSLLPVPKDKWKHVVVTHALDPDGSVTQKMYVNGVIADTEPTRTIPSGMRLADTNLHHLTVGNKFIKQNQGVTVAHGFHGAIDDLYVFASALSSDEVEELYRRRWELAVPVASSDTWGSRDPYDAQGAYRIEGACALDGQGASFKDPVFGTPITRVSGLSGDDIRVRRGRNSPPQPVRIPNSSDNFTWTARMRHEYVTAAKWDASNRYLALISADTTPRSEDSAWFVTFVKTGNGAAVETADLLYSTEDQLWPGRWHPTAPRRWLYVSGPWLKEIDVIADVFDPMTTTWLPSVAPPADLDFSIHSAPCTTPPELRALKGGADRQIDKISFGGKSSSGGNRIALLGWNERCNTVLSTENAGNANQVKAEVVGPIIFSGTLFIYDAAKQRIDAAYHLGNDCGWKPPNGSSCSFKWDTLRVAPDGRFVSLNYVVDLNKITPRETKQFQMRVFEVTDIGSVTKVKPVSFRGKMRAARPCSTSSSPSHRCIYWHPGKGFLPLTGLTHPVLTGSVNGMHGIAAVSGFLYGLSKDLDLGRLVHIGFDPRPEPPGGYGLKIRSLSDGWGEAEPNHVSVGGPSDSDDPWLVVSYGVNRPLRRFNGEITLVNMETLKVRRIAQHRSYTEGGPEFKPYWHYPMATPSRDLGAVLFASDWTGGESVLPPSCPKENLPGVKAFVADTTKLIP